MSPTTPNRAGNGADAERSAPYSFLNHSDAYWASVRSLSNALLHSHHNAAALMEVHRKLSDELLEIARRQQNVALEFSEKLLQQMAEHLPNISLPRRIVLIEELPRMGSGKIDFRRVADMVREKLVRD